MKMLGNNILVQLPPKKTQTKSGIHIPDTAREGRITTGQVLEVGPGKKISNGTLIPTTLKKGDFVIFDVNRGTEHGDRQLIIEEDYIFGTVEVDVDVADNNPDLANYLNT